MTLTVGDRVRVVDDHRIKGTIRALSAINQLAWIVSGGRPYHLPFTFNELEPITPCGCTWCKEEEK